eukprot:gene19715-20181_t
MRVIIGPRDVDIYNKGIENDWDIYYRLIDEMRYCQSQGVKNAEWISWHEGAHLISQNPTGSPTFNAIQSRISRYFGINNKKVEQIREADSAAAPRTVLRDPAGPSQAAAAAAAGTGGGWRGSPREAERKRGAHRVVMAVSASADDEPLSAALTLSPPPHPLPLPLSLSDSGPEPGSGQVSASSHSEQEDGDSSAVKEAERYGLQVIGPDDLDPDLGPAPAQAPDPASPYSQRSQQNSARGRRQPRPAARLS